MEEKQAFEFLANQAVIAADKKVITNEYGETFLNGDDIHPWHENRNADRPIVTHTLRSVVDYVKTLDNPNRNYYLHVTNPYEVWVCGWLDEHGERNELLQASVWRHWDMFGEFMDREQLNIMLQSWFVDDETTDKDVLLQFVGNLKEEMSNSASDNGITQVATITTGVASQDNVIVPNPVLLRPYRTFTEIEQPASKFIFRMRQGMEGAFFESDGGAWKNEAVNNIKQYLEEHLSEMQNVVILG